MDFIDYYKILGINKTATQDEIRAAYRKLARKHHPDLNPDDKEANKKFQQVNEANEVLSDPEKRKKYDQYGKDWQHAEAFEKAQQPAGSRQGAGRTGAGNYSGFGGSADFEPGDESEFSSFFESLFGGGGGGGRRSGGSKAKFRGQDYQAELQITLEEAATTHQRILAVNGKNIRITIPAGVEDGQVIKLKGYGAPGGNGGPAGDLYITFVIENDAAYKRSGNDLYVTASVPLYTAVLGGDITIETLSGKIKLTIKPETQNGTVVRLKGKGFPVYKKEGSFGDLYITYNIQMPVNLTEKQKELFTELSKS